VRLPLEDELLPDDVLRLLLWPPPRETSPPLRATAFLVRSLAEANPFFEVPPPVEEPPVPVLREELRPPAALLAEVLLLDVEALLLEAVDRPPEDDERLLVEPERPLVEPDRLLEELVRPLVEPERLRVLSPDVLFEDDVRDVDEEPPLEEVPSLSALRLRF
jgi:hypothetical protein